MSDFDSQTEIEHKQKCSNCRAFLVFSPGTESLICAYCQTENQIESSSQAVVELDLNDQLSQLENASERMIQHTVRCDACGAISTLDSSKTADECPFCATPLVVNHAQDQEMIKPQALLPFITDRNKANQLFMDWAGSRWFAPNKLKRNAADSAQKLVGIYLPHWTYDAFTASDYTGERGEYYYTTETYTATENGKSVTKTRQVRHTRWHNVSGHVDQAFDDVLICASHSLPSALTESLSPWDLEKLIPFDASYLNGFKAEKYQIDLREGFALAQTEMSEEIRVSVKHQIGGDEQRIHAVQTDYNNLAYKYILLPLWMSSYRYNDKVYRFAINARTGEVQGERPYSVTKIASLVMAILALIALIYMMAHK